MGLLLRHANRSANRGPAEDFALSHKTAQMCILSKSDKDSGLDIMEIGKAIKKLTLTISSVQSLLSMLLGVVKCFLGRPRFFFSTSLYWLLLPALEF